MLRVVLVVLAVVVLIALLRGAVRRERPRSPSPGPAPRPAADAPPAPQEMVACAHCGVHLPRADAVVAADEAFCGEAHRLLHEQRRADGR